MSRPVRLTPAFWTCAAPHRDVEDAPSCLAAGVNPWLVRRGFAQPASRRSLVDGLSTQGWPSIRSIRAVTAHATTRDRARNVAPVRSGRPYVAGEACWLDDPSGL